jgi:hypothetical protein
LVIGEQDDLATHGKRKFKLLTTADCQDDMWFDSYDPDLSGT